MKTAATPPNLLKGNFYDGRAPIAAAVTLIWSGNTIKLIGAEIAQSYMTNELRVSPRTGRTARFIALPDGTQLQCNDHPLLDRLPQEVKSEGLAAWLEQRWWVALVCLAVTIFGLTVGYIYGLPVAAEQLAAKIPIEYEKKIGEQAVAWLDDNEMFEESEVDADVQEEINKGFAELSAGLPQAAHYHLEFRNAPAIGANAFAFPGGTIVVTDELIELSESPDEVLAVLAHEIGHVERRHAMRHLLQDSATATIATAITNDASSLTLAVSGFPVMLAQAKYSREFEAEADEFGFKLLKQHNLSPEAFATMMERMTEDREDEDERRLSFISTHPVTTERIARARAAAQE
ncbi:MAG: M48 family metallopeptidase [Gammaproteobacteria bacterium]|nr:M48 family metallopeptidase [Gammaproteobacteria bacterium]